MAQWRHTNGPFGGSAETFATLGNTLFIGSVGVFRSTDGGETWSASGLTDRNVAYLDTIGGVLVAGTDAGAFRSTDGGASWIAANQGVPALISIEGMCVAEGSLFLAIDNFGVVRSVDRGQSWSTLSNWIPGIQGAIRGLATANGTIYAGINSGVERSTDLGATWSVSAQGLGDTLNATVESAKGPDVYITANVGPPSYAYDDFRSTDGGVTWSPVSSPESNNLANGMEILNGTLYAFDAAEYSDSGVSLYSSTDLGTTWTAAQGVENSDITMVASANGTLLALGSNTGIYRSTDNGANWNLSNQGFIDSYVNALAGDSSNLYAATYDLFRSSDNGASWSAGTEQGEPKNDNMQCLVAHNGLLFAGYLSSGEYISSDQGAHWHQLDTVPSPTAFAFSGQKWYYATDRVGIYPKETIGAVYESLDQGATWNNIGPDDTLGGSQWPITVSAIWTSGDTLLAATDDGYFVTTDDGADWRQDTLHAGFLSFAEADGVLYACGRGGYENGAPTLVSGVFRSTDNGTTWEPTAGMQDSAVTFVGAYSNGIFALTNSGWFYSTDAGATWASTELPDSTPGLLVSVMVTKSDLVIGTAWHGVRERPLSDFGIAGVEDQAVRQTVELEAPYPNPAATSTSFHFSLPRAEWARLEIYTALGARVATLAQGEEAAGDHAITFSGAGLPNGVYFVRLAAGGSSQSSILTIEH